MTKGEVHLGRPEGAVGHHFVGGEPDAAQLHRAATPWSELRWLLYPLIFLHLVALVAWVVFLARAPAERPKPPSRVRGIEWGMTVLQKLGLTSAEGPGRRRDLDSVPSISATMDPYAQISGAPMAPSGKDR